MRAGPDRNGSSENVRARQRSPARNVFWVGFSHPSFALAVQRPRLALCSLARSWPLVVAVACGSSDERPAPAAGQGSTSSELTHYDASNADARDVYASGRCAEGASRTCRIYLTAHDGIQPCFVGQQTCAGATWSSCADGVLVDANSGDRPLAPPSIDDSGR